MFKKILLAIMIAIPAFGFAQGRFGVVDVNAIFEAMPETATMKTQLDETTKKYEAEFQRLQEEFKREYDAFQALEESTPQAIKDRRVQTLQELDNKIQQFRQTASQDIQRQQEAAMAPIQEKIINAIKAVGDEGNYTFIFENAVSAYTGNEVVDVTNLVKSHLGIATK